MLITSKRFGPFFLTQALGAFNDNLFKNLLVLLLTYQASTYHSSLSPSQIANLAAGCFIAPFALFSGLGGHLADHYNKARLIQWLKGMELLIMLIASAGLLTQNTTVLFACVFLMGAQSAFFGPVKYAYLPAVLKEEELMGGNALVETVTFVMILLGTLSAGVLTVWANHATHFAVVLCGVSLLGFVASFAVQPSPVMSQSPLRWHTAWTSNILAFQHARENRAVWLSVLGISWFWFLGAMVLAQLPELAKNSLALNESGLTWLLALFSLGVGAGSMLSERWSGKKVEIGLVPLGSIGLTVFLIAAFVQLPLETPNLVTDNTLVHFQDNPAAVRFGVYLALVGIFGGLYIVPLYALIQSRSNPAHVASVVSANNIMNAAFMVGAAAIGLVFGLLGIGSPWLVLCAGIANMLVAVYIYGLLPEFLWRFIVWLMVHTVYRFKVKGSENIPEHGPCVVVCNHVGYSDAVVLAAAVRRPLRFIMYYKIFEHPALGWFFKTAKAIPIAGRSEDEAVFNAAFERVAKALDEGEIVCVFPEGKLSADGEVDVFRPGLLRILERNNVPVIPMALGGLWGSLFTRRHGGLARLREREWGRPVDLLIGKPVAAENVEMEDLRQRVIALRTRP